MPLCYKCKKNIPMEKLESIGKHLVTQHDIYKCKKECCLISWKSGKMIWIPLYTRKDK